MKKRNIAAITAAATLFVTLPVVVHADAQSPVVSAALSAGATRMENAALRRNFSRLLADWAKEREMEARTDGPVEVLAWTGDAYRPGRSEATRAAVLRALKAAGYECQDIDHEEIRVNAFTEEVGLASDYSGEGSLGITFRDPQRGLVAVNPKTGKALVGYWFDQQE